MKAQEIGTRKTSPNGTGYWAVPIVCCDRDFAVCSDADVVALESLRGDSIAGLVARLDPEDNLPVLAFDILTANHLLLTKTGYKHVAIMDRCEPVRPAAATIL